MNRQQLQESKCQECGSIPPCWKRIDGVRDWGALGTGERWHCDNCDSYLVIVPFEPLDHEPVRGSEIDNWIVANRDKYAVGESEWDALDDLLDLYRMMADEGITLLEARMGGGSRDE